MIIVGGQAQDVGRGRVAAVGTVVGLNAAAAGVHLLNDGRAFHGEQQRGSSLRGRCSDGVHHVVRDRPRREPNRVADVVAHDEHGVVRRPDVEDVVHLDQIGHFVGRRGAGEQHVAFNKRGLIG